MDFKPFYLMISALAVAGGIGWGWMDAEAIHKQGDPKVESDPKTGTAPIPDTADPASSKRQGEERIDISAGYGSEDDPSELAESGAGTKGSDDSGQGSQRFEAPTLDEDDRLESISQLLVAQEFDKVISECERLADSTETLAREDALRLRARAVAFQALIPPVKIAPKSGKVYEIRLSNDQLLTAIRVEERPDKYLLTLQGGMEYAPRREDVLEIKEIDASNFQSDRWKKMASKMKKYDHPIDLYVRGVRKCYQEGFRREGYKLFEKLLEMPGSDQVPRFFGKEPDENENLVKQWEIAAGRRPATKRSAVLHAVARAPTPTPGLAGETSPGSPALSFNLQETLADAQKLAREARTTYQSVINKSNNQDALHGAFEKLRQAQDLLALLPAGRDTTPLMREVATLMVDIGKSLPFDI